MKNLLPNNIVELPPGLNSTNLYDLLTKLDSAFINGIQLGDSTVLTGYQSKFHRDDEYAAIREAVDFLYIPYESTEDATEIDKNYLSMLILSGKSTRLFSETLLRSDSNPPRHRFNITGYLNDPNHQDFITTSASNPYELIINAEEVTASDSNEFYIILENLISHLLYFHSLSIILEHFFQEFSVNLVTRKEYAVMNINSSIYEPYN